MLGTPDALLIDGQWRAEASGGSLTLIEPATEQPWHSVPAAGLGEIDEAATAAARAFREAPWANASPRDRANALFRLAALIREQVEDLAVLESRNVGKPIADSRDEVLAGARCMEYYAGAVSTFGGETPP
ncbi:MAG: aldehyde dehydrogenase, partial [Armatimonadetes bacterium]|nr:aldehyde dehydrogenase [Armatimonadota bacterium]